jgi:F0F1-type ATP synthase membrane subunit c/vacuolar-type H+-ATPase subunit K
MTTRQLLKTPTPWLATGMGLIVGLVFLLTGWGDGLAGSLREGYVATGFPPLSERQGASLFSLTILILGTFGSVIALEGTPGTGKRVMLLASSLVVIAMASPVLALWGIFWSPFELLFAVSWASIAAMIHAANRERHESQEPGLEEGLNVVRMQERRLPPNRKMK